MKKRPLIVYLIALVALLFPLIMVAQVLLLRDVGLGEAFRRFAWAPAPIVAPWEYLFATAVAWFLAFAVYQVKRWSWWLVVGACVLLVAHNVFVMTHRIANFTDLKLWVNLAVTIAPALAVTLLLRREVRSPFFNPRIRWWEQDPRFPIDAPLEGGGRVLDISSTGMFIECSGEPPTSDQKVSAAFQVGDVRLEVEAEVIWTSAGDDTHPPGAGLRFDALDAAASTGLRRVLAEQRKLGRRQWHLRAVRYPADIRCNQEEAVLDLSMTGMFVQSQVEREMGEVAEFDLQQADHQLTVSGEVVWITEGSHDHPRGYGVRFTRLSDDTREGLARLLDTLRKAAEQGSVKQR